MYTALKSTLVHRQEMSAAPTDNMKVYIYSNLIGINALRLISTLLYLTFEDEIDRTRPHIHAYSLKIPQL